MTYNSLESQKNVQTLIIFLVNYGPDRQQIQQLNNYTKEKLNCTNGRS